MSDEVRYEREGNVAVITLNNPPVNALGHAVRVGLVDALEKADADDDVKAVIIIGTGRGFSGGADIREFGKPRPEPLLVEVIAHIEVTAKPVVAAIHGMAVGGGCELPLGCHYRVGDETAQMGLPEVKLGLIPGAGGTQRLPRLIGLKPALDMIVSGEYVGAERAAELGLLDELIDGDLKTGAIRFAEKLIANGTEPRRIRDMQPDDTDAKELFEKARATAARRMRGLDAPQRCIDSIENSTTLPIDDALQKEREFFAELESSEQSRALRHLFFAEREAHRIPGVPKDTPLRPIARAAVIGCGTMGRGIAMSLANGGVPVTVIEVDQKALDAGLEMARKTYAGSVSRGSLSQGDMDARMTLIGGTTSYDDIADADIVIEAVFEDMELKKKIFTTLDSTCKQGTILATNTSSLDVNEIAAATKRPGDVIGTHFFSPANVMKLMENVRGAKTAPDVIATVMKLSKDINKVGVMVGVCNGFVGNRMLYAYKTQAEYLLEEGALPHQVDKVVTDFGFPMGPFAVSDLAGLDVGYLVRKHRREIDPPKHRESYIGDRIVEMGRHGQKTSKGWFLYEEGNRVPQPDPEIEDLIVGISEELGIERREITDQEILERCLYPLINEGAKILAEGIAIRPSDIDVIWIYGYGFPRGRGGPMFYADQVGAKTIFDVMQRLYEVHGDLLKPAPLLKELANAGKSFADCQAEKKIN
ncbi:MAG: 3-hydroxyacyl-CoA dehydrogenase NAD-binding domain-containing protein [Hyphomicrobiaceae bacterium]|nr:3-hydroxyacyl-CoA dehydrogenase NAD-binding domain-containing protein [Hyphomicrobiaceae bacterium]